MFTAPIAFMTSLVTQAVGFALPVVGLALIVSGGIWALGNHQEGQAKSKAALIGGAVMLLAQQIATGLSSMPH